MLDKSPVSAHLHFTSTGIGGRATVPAFHMDSCAEPRSSCWGLNHLPHLHRAFWFLITGDTGIEKLSIVWLASEVWNQACQGLSASYPTASLDCCLCQATLLLPGGGTRLGVITAKVWTESLQGDFRAQCLRGHQFLFTWSLPYVSTCRNKTKN